MTGYLRVLAAVLALAVSVVLAAAGQEPLQSNLGKAMATECAESAQETLTTMQAEFPDAAPNMVRLMRLMMTELVADPDAWLQAQDKPASDKVVELCLLADKMIAALGDARRLGPWVLDREWLQ